MGSTLVKRRKEDDRVAAALALFRQVPPPHNAEVARLFGVDERTVYRWKKRDRALTQRKSAGNPDAPVLSYTTASLRAFYEALSGNYWPDHWTPWADDYFAFDRLLINVPPRHGKSKLFSVWIPLFEVCFNPDVQILLVSASNDLAKKWSNEISWHLMNNQQMISWYGPFEPAKGTAWPWKPLQGEMMVARRQRSFLMGDMTIQIKGRKEHILGTEADRIVLDDVVDLEDMQSESERRKVSIKVHGDILTRLTKKGKAVAVGQRLAPQDIYAELANKRLALPGNPPLWRHVSYPAVLDWEKHEVLWQREWPWERLMEKYADLQRDHKNDLFMAMYQQQPVAGETAIIRREWIEGDESHPGCWDLDRAYGEPAKPLGPAWQRTRILSIDPSPTKQTGLILADVQSQRLANPSGTIQSYWTCSILEVEGGRWDLRRIVSETKRIVEGYRPDYLIFEVNAAQRWFFQDYEFLMLQRAWHLPVVYHTTTGQKKAEDGWGPQSLSRDFERGLVRLPGKDGRGRVQSQTLIDEGLYYGSWDHDDRLMALWFVKWNYRNLAPRRSLGGGPDLQQVGPYNAGWPVAWEGWGPRGETDGKQAPPA